MHIRFVDDANAARGQQLLLAFVPRNDAQIATGQRQRLRNELTQPPRANEQDTIRRLDINLLLNLQRGGEGFGEDSHLVRHRNGDFVQIRNW